MTAPTAATGTLRAFRHRDFAVFWSGALVSNTGSWLQNLTVPFVIYQVTGSALWVGMSTAAQFLPGVLGAPVGGHLADTRERRRLLILLQSMLGVTALLLWGAWVSGNTEPGWLLLLVTVTGLLHGLSLPVWQAFVTDLVPRDDLVSAVGLNSLQFNAARSLGPALAGLVIAALGAGWAFALNAASYCVVVIAVVAVRTRTRREATARAVGLASGFARAVRYVGGQPGIALGIAVAAVVGLLTNPVFGFTVVFAGSVYGVGAIALGLLNTALGLGAVLAVPLVVRAKSHGGLAVSTRRGLVMQGIGVVGLGVSPGYAAGLLCLLVIGMGFLTAISSTNSAVQLIVAPALRGRVMALRLMTFMVATAIGSLLLGALADRVGPRAATVTAGGLILVVATLFATRRGARALTRLDDPEDASTG